MQTDMHYYGTFAMARAAGLSLDTCKTIATCSEYVDDNAGKISVLFKDGARIDTKPSAHHLTDIHNAKLANINDEDQRHIWVPFHFLPGNEGEDYTERLVCRKNSDIAQEMVSYYLSNSHSSFIAELIGVCAHVYADTFSHYGFSGVSSRRNNVDQSQLAVVGEIDPDIKRYVEEKAESFFSNYEGRGAGLLDNIKAWCAEKLTGALGHGGAATYPDRPFLEWIFYYEYPIARREHRVNADAFLEGCRALYSMFARLAEARPDLTDKSVEWVSIEANVRKILATQDRLEARINAWKDATERGLLGSAFMIPDYNAMTFDAEFSSLNESEDSTKALETSLFRFHQAVEMHLTYVIKQLLPSHGLVLN